MSRTVVARTPRDANRSAAMSSSSARRPDLLEVSSREGVMTDILSSRPRAGSCALGGDRHDLAGQIGRVVAGEHRDGGRDLPDLGGAAVGLTGGEVVEQFLAGDLREEGVAGDG